MKFSTTNVIVLAVSGHAFGFPKNLLRDSTETDTATRTIQSCPCNGEEHVVTPVPRSDKVQYFGRPGPHFGSPFPQFPAIPGMIVTKAGPVVAVYSNAGTETTKAGVVIEFGPAHGRRGPGMTKTIWTGALPSKGLPWSPGTGTRTITVHSPAPTIANNEPWSDWNGRSQTSKSTTSTNTTTSSRAPSPSSSSSLLAAASTTSNSNGVGPVGGSTTSTSSILSTSTSMSSGTSTASSGTFSTTSSSSSSSSILNPIGGSTTSSASSSSSTSSALSSSTSNSLSTIGGSTMGSSSSLPSTLSTSFTSSSASASTSVASKSTTASPASSSGATGPVAGTKSSSSSSSSVTSTSPNSTVSSSTNPTESNTTSTSSPSTVSSTSKSPTSSTTPLTTTSSSSTINSSSSTSIAPNAAITDDVSSLSAIDAILEAHNIHRANHTAGNLTWSDSLASTAARIAATCIYEHNITVDGGGYGQNIGAGYTADRTPSMIGNSMYNGEMPNYPQPYGNDNPDMRNFGGWGHFSQIVWKGTQQVGCATQHCPDGVIDPTANPPQNISGIYDFTVCNYNPPGNIQAAYSQVGAPLSQPIVVISPA